MGVNGSVVTLCLDGSVTAWAKPTPEGCLLLLHTCSHFLQNGGRSWAPNAHIR